VTPAVRLLEQHGVPHELLSYDDSTLQPGQAGYGLAAAEALGLPPAAVFKTLLAEIDGKAPCVAVLPVAQRLDGKALGAAAGGRRATLLPADRSERLTGYVLGAISPLGQRRRLPTFIDRSALALAQVYVSAGRRGLELGLAPEALLRLCNADLVDLTAAS